MKKAAPPGSIDAYLAALVPGKRTVLQKLRREIRAAAPDAEECISYGIPAFRLRGKLLVAFGAAAMHCAFYPGAYPLRVHAGEVEGYDTSRGTIRFSPEKPLPASLVRKLVKARVAEHAAGSSASGPTKPR